MKDQMLVEVVERCLWRCLAPVSLSGRAFAEGHAVMKERQMKRYLSLVVLFAVAAMALPCTFSAFADEPATSSAITHYIQNARTPEDHQAIAAYFDSEAARATATAEQYKEFNCHRSQSTELQRSGTQFPEVTAKQHCRKMLRHYLNKAEEDRMAAEYHRNVANNWPPSSVSSPGNYE